jgi:hypothetical protein
MKDRTVGIGRSAPTSPRLLSSFTVRHGNTSALSPVEASYAALIAQL